MFTQIQNMTAKIIGKWKCIDCRLNDEEITNIESFTLIFSKNSIQCLAKDNELWPGKCGYEPIGSKDGGYYFREDGCFFQVKNLKESTVDIELNLKVTGDNSIVKYFFTMEKQRE